MRTLFAVGMLLVGCTVSRGGDAVSVTPVEAREALGRATVFMQSLSVGGGYLWLYSLDLQRRAGESVADADHIWIQPPGTPAVGEAYLRAHAATGEQRYLDAARTVAEALGRCQLASGGWHYSANTARPEDNRDGQLDYKGRAFARANPGKPINPLYMIATTFDDDNTQSAVRFLTACVVAARGTDPRDRAIRATLDRALEGMLRAQYPNGAWPERYHGRPHDPALHVPRAARIPVDYPRTWPRDADYTAGYTLNDDAQRDCILTLLDAAEKLGEPRWREAAKRGGDFLIRAQLPEPQAVWAQQYNFAMEPAWARVWEPPGVVSHESGGALRTLVALHLATGERRYLEPLRTAVAWFERSQIAPGRWARFYELGTNRPIYGDMDGRIHHALAEISAERRAGYRWEDSYGLPEVLAECRELLADGRETYRRRRQPMPPAAGARTKIEAAAARAVAALDERGRWVTRERMTKRAPEAEAVSTAVFAARVGALCDFIEAAGAR